MRNARLGTNMGRKLRGRIQTRCTALITQSQNQMTIAYLSFKIRDIFRIYWTLIIARGGIVQLPG